MERLSADLRAEFPGMPGLAPRSLEYMRTFASAWPEPIAWDCDAGKAAGCLRWLPCAARPSVSGSSSTSGGTIG